MLCSGRTLDLAGAVDAMAACPLAALQREAFNREVVAANVVDGEGLFIAALRRALRRRHLQVPFDEHDLLRELHEQNHPVRSAPIVPPRPRLDGRRASGPRTS